MHGIYIAAIITTGISVLLWGGLFCWLSKKPKNLALTLIALPFSTIVNLLIKKPIYESALSSLGIPPQLSTATPWWFLLFALFLSPLTEEAIKLSPLVTKQLRRLVDQSSAFWIGTALGMGFGIGEIWYLAWRFSMVPEFAVYPFYYFVGFISERMAVVFVHGVMTAVAVTGFVKGEKGLLRGYVGAVLLHAFTNIGAMLYQTEILDVTAASLYLFFPMLVSFFIFERLRKKTLRDRKPSETVFFSRN
jgi:uncharacterized membrane protein YhfC